MRFNAVACVPGQFSDQSSVLLPTVVTLPQPGQFPGNTQKHPIGAKIWGEWGIQVIASKLTQEAAGQQNLDFVA